MKYIIPIIVLTLVLLGCKKEDDASSSNTELEGTWVVSCYASGSYYLIKTFTFTGTNVVEKYEYHSDSSCATDHDTWETTYTSLNIGDAQVFSTYGTSGGTGAEFTMTLSSNTYTAHTSALVSSNNTNSYCGLTGWVLNTAQDVQGKTCGSTTYWATNTAVYGLYILDGTKFIPNYSRTSYPNSVSSATSNIFNKQ